MSNIKVPDFNKLAKDALEGLPKEVAEKARAFFLTSFIKEGFTDNNFIAWPKRRDELTHKMLSQSLKLRESVQIKEANFNRIVISAGENIPYAEIHNNGGTILVPVTKKMRKYFWMMFKKTNDEKYKWMALTKKEQMTINIPKRQFIGESFALENKIDALFIARILKEQRNLKT